MNRRLKLLLALTLTLGLFTSCNKKDDDTQIDIPVPQENYFTYDGVQYDLSQGFIQYWGIVATTTDHYHYTMQLLSSGFTVEVNNGELGAVTGKGDMLFFDLICEDNNQLTSGTYEYDATTTDVGYMIGSSVGFNFNQQDFSGTMYQVTGGTLTIEKDGAMTVLTYNLTDENGKTISGQFKKELTIYNSSW